MLVLGPPARCRAILFLLSVIALAGAAVVYLSLYAYVEVALPWWLNATWNRRQVRKSIPQVHKSTR